MTLVRWRLKSGEWSDWHVPCAGAGHVMRCNAWRPKGRGTAAALETREEGEPTCSLCWGRLHRQGRRPANAVPVQLTPGAGSPKRRRSLTQAEVAAAVRKFQAEGGTIAQMPYSDLGLRVAQALFHSQGEIA